MFVNYSETHKQRMTLLVLFVFVFIFSKASSNENRTVEAKVSPYQLCLSGEESYNCSFSLTSEEVVLGWPHLLSCGSMFEDMNKYLNSFIEEDYLNYEEEESGNRPACNATCLITDDQNRVLLNRTIKFDKNFRDLHHVVRPVTRSQTYVITGWLSESQNRYYVIKLKLNAVVFERPNCNQSLTTMGASLRKGRVREQLHFLCEAPTSATPKLYKDVGSNYTSVWYKNCQELSQQPSRRAGASARDEFFIRRLGFNDSGIYSCAISLEGMTRFVHHYDLCVVPEKITSKTGLKCKKKVYRTKRGSDVTMTCMSNYQSSKQPSYSIGWSKMTTRGVRMVCQNYIGANSFFTNNPLASCSSRSNFVCADPKFGRRDWDTLEMTLHLKNIQDSDFANYILNLTTMDASSSEIISLADDVADTLRDVSSMLVVYIIILLILIFVMGLMWRFRIYLLIFWKRKFARFVLDDKKYGAYLSYHYSWDGDKFAKQQARDVVSAVRDALTRLGYTMFDENRDCCAVSVESSLSSISECHRILIFLTTGFLRDHRKVSTLQKGFLEAIQSTSKLIFILVPGMKEYLKQHSAHDDTVLLVRRAIKLNCAIEWSDDPKFNTKLFSLYLERKMPKLDCRGSSRHSSTSSSMTSQIHYKNGFKRTASCDTGLTEVITPVSTEKVFSDFSFTTSTVT